MRKDFIIFLLIVLILGISCTKDKETNQIIQQFWRPLPSNLEQGLLAERVSLWRTDRLWYMVDSGYLLSGFENRPGIHPWQGEHVGKWLHAATLAYEQTHDEELGNILKEIVERLLAAQETNGYLGTYAEEERFYIEPTDKRSWDIWSHRYNLYGLITYERYNRDDRIVQACERMGDLLIDTFGEGRRDITKNGTRRGISSTTLIESIMMLYQRTQKERFLNFAEHIVECSEKASGLRLKNAMLNKEDVSDPGDGKAYQLMANLIGYLLLYRSTGNSEYFLAVENGWKNIMEHHLYVTGGPWSRHMSYNGNMECFALPEDFLPGEAVVETCSKTTWIQLNLHLFEQTGEAKYAIEAERAIFNSLLASQYKEGIGWCYFTKANQDSRPFEEDITCCASSGPRALELFSHYLVGEHQRGISLMSLVPCSVNLPEKFGKAKFRIIGNFPYHSKIEICCDEAGDEKFAIEFRDPLNANLQSIQLNGEDMTVRKNKRGFYPISRSWKKGDKIILDFDYQLRVHPVISKEDQRWVAFIYGPWSLAQCVKKGADVSEPFAALNIPSTSVLNMLEPYQPKEGMLPKFKIKGTQIVLEPFYMAGSHTSGPRTYFKL
jgi:DUF1680 family protein